ncbi:MAG: nucleotide exchange factor GrpE [Alphaproteobacteria bacterium]|nr:nucleotide exchange factor GrpE [Alphaproteobacteria bacterium]
MTDPQHQEIPESEAQPESVPDVTPDDTSQQFAELTKILAETHDKMLRALAELENTRRRAERERQDTAKFSVASFARALLTVSDNLRRALDAIPEDERDKNEQLKTIFIGVESTERELLRIFENNGIKKIDSINKKFDPNLHEVLFETSAEGKDSGIITQVIEPGYMIHERLLRPARVGVAKSDTTPEGSKVDKQV